MTLLETALHYAARGWPVFRLTIHKVPFKGSHGHLDATTDPDIITAWWTDKPFANIGLACGDIVVLDCDGQEGVDQLRAFADELGGLPPTLMARTPRGGLHVYYHAPIVEDSGEAGGTRQIELRSYNSPRKVKGGPGLDIKGVGGYVLMPPSHTPAGVYAWMNALDVADMPAGLVALLQQWSGRGETRRGDTRVVAARVPLPAHLVERMEARKAAREKSRELGGIGENTGPLHERGLKALATPWTAHEEARVRAALAALPGGIGYDNFLKIGFALHGLGWDRSDGTSAGFEIFDEFCARFPAHYNPAQLEYKWASFGKHQRNSSPVTVATIFKLAQDSGWDGQVETANVNGVNGVHALPDSFHQVNSDSIAFPDTNKMGRPVATCRNTRVALKGLGVACEYDAFHERLRVGGAVLQQWAGEFSDNAAHVLRTMIDRTYGFDAGLVNIHDAAVQECLEQPHNPIVEYLDRLAWDGRARLAGWLATYLGADATSLNAETGRLMLVAAVRRARHPGVKFDQIMVLEGREGRSKSTAVELLAGTDNFSDQTILGAGDREVQELLTGVWLYEIADLTGISRADTERVKAFASRKVDRARPAYGRVRVDRPRQCVFFATTNDVTYLRSETGNRRFWPVQTGHIDLKALARDRDQLWAEAAAIEAQGGSLWLAESFWGAAAAVQDSRREHDPWDDIINAHVPKQDHEKPDGRGSREWRISSRDLLDLVLRLPIERQSNLTAKRLAFVMRRCGWDGPRVFWENGLSVRGYTKDNLTAKVR